MKFSEIFDVTFSQETFQCFYYKNTTSREAVCMLHISCLCNKLQQLYVKVRD